MPTYVALNSAEERRATCAALRTQCPDAVPVVVEGVRDGKFVLTAVPRAASVAELAEVVRRQIQLSAERPLSLAVDGCTVASTTTLGELHDACKQSDDGMLYVTYAAEQRMGSIATATGPCGVRFDVW